MRPLERSLAHKADCYIDEHHGRFATLGKRMFREFGSDSGKTSSQVRNLQQVAFSATRLADVEDFVKNQMGRQVKHWRDVGDYLLAGLLQLRQYSDEQDASSTDKLALRLHLGRGWVNAVVGEYLYQLALAEMRGKA